MKRRRWLLIAAPLWVVASVATVAAAAPSDTEHSKDAKIDDLHVKRPIAAPNRVLDRLVDPVVKIAAINSHLERMQQARVGTLLQAIQVGDFLGSLPAEHAPPSDPETPAHGPAPAATDDGSGGGDSLACIRAHESDSAGGYSAVSQSGAYRGAYQFAPGTWNSTAASAGRSDLVGVDPASASPSDQDTLAAHLYSEAGSQPWGGRC